MAKRKEPSVGKPKTGRRKPARVSGEQARIKGFAIEAARLSHDSHCQDILVLDVQGLSDLMDYIVIATGTSDRQIRSVGHEVEELAEKSGLKRYGRDEDGHATWIVVDFVDVVVHIFEPAARAHYDLEMLWGDAPRLRWQRRTTPGKPAAKDESAD